MVDRRDLHLLGLGTPKPEADRAARHKDRGQDDRNGILVPDLLEGPTRLILLK
jgi:hypothetical protein